MVDKAGGTIYTHEKKKKKKSFPKNICMPRARARLSQHFEILSNFNSKLNKPRLYML